jgi:hypothetical protein
MMYLLPGPLIIEGVLCAIGPSCLRISIYEGDVKEGPLAGMVLKSEDLLALCQEINPLVETLVGELPVSDRSKGVAELARLELKGSQVDEIGCVGRFWVWGGRQDQDTFIFRDWD